VPIEVDLQPIPISNMATGLHKFLSLCTPHMPPPPLKNKHPWKPPMLAIGDGLLVLGSIELWQLQNHCIGKTHHRQWAT
jgi:hypothetical protein